MSCVATPILIAIRYDFMKADYDLRVILAPVTFAWILLPVVLIMMSRIVDNEFKEIQSIRKMEGFKELEGTPFIKIKGRNTIHNS